MDRTYHRALTHTHCALRAVHRAAPSLPGTLRAAACHCAALTCLLTPRCCTGRCALPSPPARLSFSLACAPAVPPCAACLAIIG